jgi:membrane protein implicated in regulation of membrane protease activity
MNRIVGILKSTYNFFAGDAIILGAVIVAFGLAAVLVHAVHAPNALTGLLFIVCVVAGLVLTLTREVAGRPRHR